MSRNIVSKTGFGDFKNYSTTLPANTTTLDLTNIIVNKTDKILLFIDGIESGISEYVWNSTSKIVTFKTKLYIR